jgi:hypothetical protein
LGEAGVVEGAEMVDGELGDLGEESVLVFGGAGVKEQLELLEEE